MPINCLFLFSFSFLLEKRERKDIWVAKLWTSRKELEVFIYLCWHLVAIWIFATLSLYFPCPHSAGFSIWLGSPLVRVRETCLGLRQLYLLSWCQPSFSRHGKDDFFHNPHPFVGDSHSFVGDLWYQPIYRCSWLVRFAYLTNMMLPACMACQCRLAVIFWYLKLRRYHGRGAEGIFCPFLWGNIWFLECWFVFITFILVKEGYQMISDHLLSVQWDERLQSPNNLIWNPGQV